MSLNISKCLAIRFGSHPRQCPSYQIGNLEICSTTSHRDLGIHVTNSLSWSEHCGKICQKAYRSLNLLRRTISSTHIPSTKRRLYVSLVRSNLTYCSQMWRPNLHKDIENIERVQRRATKYILNYYIKQLQTGQVKSPSSNVLLRTTRHNGLGQMY